MLESEYLKIFRRPCNNPNFSSIRFKQQFKALNFYSMPNSTLWVVKKRLNLIFIALYWVILLIYSIL